MKRLLQPLNLVVQTPTSMVPSQDPQKHWVSVFNPKVSKTQNHSKPKMFHNFASLSPNSSSSGLVFLCGWTAGVIISGKISQPSKSFWGWQHGLPLARTSNQTSLRESKQLPVSSLLAGVCSKCSTYLADGPSLVVDAPQVPAIVCALNLEAANFGPLWSSRLNP